VAWYSQFGGNTALGGGTNPTGPNTGLGTNPQVPLPTTTAPGAVTGNIANLGNLYGLAQPTNQFNIGQSQQPLIQGLPNYQQMVSQSSQNIGSQLKGQVAPDVISELLQGAAERGIMTGSPGSPNSNAAYLRALGLTSAGLQQQGEANLTGAIGRTPQAPLFNPASMFVSPDQQQQAASANALYAAAPNPTAVAQANLGAAQGGLAAGRGSIVPPSFNPMAQGQGASFNPVASSTGTDLTQTGPSPTAYQNWNNWWSGMQQPGGAQQASPQEDPLAWIMGQDQGTQNWLGSDLGAQSGYGGDEEAFYGGGQ
jgi:hypothetical protein